MFSISNLKEDYVTLLNSLEYLTTELREEIS